jgi:hypothetical protein
MSSRFAISIDGAQEDITMLRKIVLASIAAASLGIGLAGLSTSASAEHWGGPRSAFDGGYGGYGYGPPPWMRGWHWRRHHHFGPPAYEAPRSAPLYGRPGPHRPYW